MSSDTTNPTMDTNNSPEFLAAVERTASMTSDSTLRDMAQAHGMNVVNVMWEDTGRTKGSCCGPNISDVTIEVQHPAKDGRGNTTTCMPVIRHPNFSDKTGDLDIDKLWMLTGNEKGEEDLQPVKLTTFLENLRDYLSTPDSWAGERTSMMAERDSHVLVSAQACFLPVPLEGKAEFNPVIFNYQSREDDPAVLSILVTRTGTSVTIIDNERDGLEDSGYSRGQRLFLNKDGERTRLSAQRLTDFKVERGDADVSTQDARDEGLNMVMMIQVPLKQKPQIAMRGFYASAAGAGLESFVMCASACSAELASNVEDAVIDYGTVEGPFTEIDDMEIKRDPRYPVRVTVQYYKATTNGVVTEADMQEMADQINKVYEQSDYVGSLVVDESNRPTEHDGPRTHPFPWWHDFWMGYEEREAVSCSDALLALRGARTAQWLPADQPELEAALEAMNKKDEDDGDN